MRPSRFPAIVVSLLAAIPSVQAASTVNLPAWVCGSPDTLLRSSFDTAEFVPHDPSGGSGGSDQPADQQVSINVAGLGARTYFLHLPAGYSAARPWPLLIALHGAGGPGTADTAAATVRNDWSAIADTNGLIVAAPSGGGSGGGWIAPQSSASGATDYNLIAAVRDEVEAKYNVERARLYVWGYSAGGHVAHDLVENAWQGFGANSVASYAVSAGILHAVTCDVTQPASFTRSTCASVLGNQARRTPVQMHIGNSDPYVSEVQGDRDRFTANGWVLGNTVVYTIFVGGHEYAGTLGNRVWPKLCPFAIAP